ncbi:MAG: hypothetical protein ACYCZB_08325 [Acidiphilium sp.]
MPRTGRTRSKPKLVPVLAPVLAGILAAASCCFALAAWLVPLWSARLPALGPHGIVFATNAGRENLIACLLPAAAAGLLAARTGHAAIIGLVFAVGVALFAADPYALFFAGLFALLLIPRAGPFGWAALPAVLSTLALPIPPDASLAPLLVGCATLVLAGWHACAAPNLAHLARSVAIGFAGMALAAIGLGNPAAALVAAEAAAFAVPVLGIVAAEIEIATGTCSLDWLGGLARGMPRFSALGFGGCFFAALLPPGPGFHAFRAVLERAIALGGGVGAIIVLALSVGFALNGFAMVRAFGLTCLGRPRSLRAAAAEEASRRTLTALALPVMAGFVFGIAHAPVAAALLAALFLLVRRFATRAGPVELPPFEAGFARPPSWLPFGDPATQITGTGFASSLPPPPRAARVRAWIQAMRR